MSERRAKRALVFPSAGFASAWFTSSKLLSSGTFSGSVHRTTGKASIYDLGSGKRLLRLSSFSTSNSPDVRVYLVKGTSGTDNDLIKSGGFLELGKLKDNIGNQNCPIPAGTDLTKYHAVTIWCNRFSANFGSTTLTDAKAKWNRLCREQSNAPDQH